MPSLAPNDQAGFFTAGSGSSTGPYVISVNGRSGIVTLTHNDITDWTAATASFLTANQPITISGDGTAGPASTGLTLTLNTQSGLTAGTYAGITVNGKGIVTGATPLSLANMGQSGATSGQVPTWNGTAWVPHTPASGTGTGSLVSIAAGSGLSGGTITTSGTISLAPIATGTILSNVGTSGNVPAGNTLNQVLSAGLGADVANSGGVVIQEGYPNQGTFALLAPGASGLILTSNGTSTTPSWQPAPSAAYMAGANISVTNGTIAVIQTGFPVDLYSYAPGTLVASQPLLEVDLIRQVSFAANMAGCTIKADAAPSNAATFTISNNGTTEATAVMAQGATVASFSSQGTWTASAGSLLSVGSPTAADATLAGVRVALTGTR